MENFTQVASTTTLRDARQQFLDNDITNRSNASGVAFPTANLYVGMFCFRTDDGGLYQLKSIGPNTWVKLFDIDTGRASDSELLDGQEGAFYQNASNLNAGTVPSARLSGSYAISISGNANTATTASVATALQNARLIGDESFNGTADVVPSRIVYKDTRAVDFAPTSYPGATVHLKTNTTDGLSDGGTYHATLHIQQWTDVSGGQFHQLGFTDSGNVWQRTGTSATAWGAWKRMLDSANFNSFAPTLTGGGASGTWAISITGSAGSLGGIPLQANRSAAVGANQVVASQGNGYVYLNYINTNTPVNENPAVGQIMVTNTGDNAFIRKASVAHVAAAIRAAETTTISKSLTLTEAWIDTGIASTNIPVSGTYAVQVMANDSAVGGGNVTEEYSGVMSWFAGATTGTDVDEIVLHAAGANRGAHSIYLRVVRVASGTLKLQISGTGTNSGASTYTFKFRLLID